MATRVPGFDARIRFALAWSRLSLKARLRPGSRLDARVRWQDKGGSMLSAVVADLSELKVIHEVFVLSCYDLPDAGSPRVIVDAGSNVGISILHFSERYPQARIIGIEPHPGTFERLRANTAHLPGVELVRAALTDEEGTVSLFAGDESWAASLTPGDHGDHQIRVPAVTLDEIVLELELETIDILKLDIEGAERSVLTSSSVLDRVRMIVFEFHQEHSPESLWALLGKLDDFRLVRLRGDSGVHPLVTLTRSRGVAGSPRSQ